MGCVFIKLHITAQSGAVFYSSFYAATACNPLMILHVTHLDLGVTFREHIHSWLEMHVVVVCASRHNNSYFSPPYDGSRPEPHSLDINCPEKNTGTKTREMVDRLVPLQHMGRADFSPLGATNRDGNPTNRERNPSDSPFNLSFLTLLADRASTIPSNIMHGIVIIIIANDEAIRGHEQVSIVSLV